MAQRKGMEITAYPVKISKGVLEGARIFRLFRRHLRKYLDFFGDISENVKMKRHYLPHVREFMGRKILLLTGPRQSGKTTLSKMFSDGYGYLNYDSEDDREIYREKSWDRKVDFIIFDELHKMKNWKRWLKGLFDREGNRPALVVTGSARLDTHRKTGDSLAGRYFQYRIHPFDLRELVAVNKKIDRKEALERLFKYGGFPEPYLERSEKFYNLWKKTHLDIILRQDLIAQEHMREIQSLEILIDLLKKRVSSPLSYSSLAGDVQSSDKTLKRWLNLLENMYVVFKILPFHKNIARANLKKPKYYFYDIPRISDEGARLENLVACSLLKECHFRQDCLGENWELHYIGKRGGLEIDFLITKDEVPQIVVETKLSDSTASKNFKYVEKELVGVKKIQLVKNISREKVFPNGVEIRSLENWLPSW